MSWSSSDARHNVRKGRLYAAISAVAWATTGLIQRDVHAGTATQVAGRSFFAFVAITLYVVAVEKRKSISGWRAIGPAGGIAALLIAIASALFIIALNHTSVAGVLMISACAPVLAGALGWALLKERVGKRTLIAMTAAVAGVIVMVNGGGGNWIGDGAALLMTIAYASHVIVVRRHREISLAPAAALAQALVVVAALPFVAASISFRDVGLLAILGAGSMGIGMSFLILAARLIRPAELTLIMLLEVVLGPVFVWLAYSEQPTNSTFAGGSVVLAAVLLQVFDRSSFVNATSQEQPLGIGALARYVVRSGESG